ncbi:peptidylprolyl isomerase [Anaeromyxobacter diazotrophicus]|nr:peptidylprolyl isomerase [Anaeromyxobacter diazotrophicus]
MILALLLAAAAPAPAAAPPPAAAPAAPAAPGVVLDRVAAVVNGDVITLGELEERAGADLRRADAEPAGPARERARARVLQQAFDNLLAEKLFGAQVAALGVEVSEAEVDQVIDDVKKRNHLDDARLEEALATQGMDRAAYRKAVKRDLESMRIIQLKIKNKVKVSDEDVQNYWQTHPQEFRSDEEVRVRHIFLALPEGAGPAEVARVRERAEKLVARLRRGEEFGLLARQASEGPSASEGGELGWLRRGTVQPEVEKAAFGMQQGQISDPVRTRSGYQILQVEERRGGGPRPLAEVKEEIRDRLMNEQADRYRSQFIAELKKDAVLDIKLPELKAD